MACILRWLVDCSPVMDPSSPLMESTLPDGGIFSNSGVAFVSKPLPIPDLASSSLFVVVFEE